MPVFRALLSLLSVVLLCGLGACASRPAASAMQAGSAEPAAGGEAPVSGRETPVYDPAAPTAGAESKEEISMAGEPAAGQEEMPAVELPEPQAGEDGAEIYTRPQAAGSAAPGAATLPVPRSPVEAGKPAKAAGSGKASASASATGKAATAGKAAGTTAAGAAQPAPVKSSAPAASAPAAKSPAAPEAVETRLGAREVLARKGDTVVIDLEGRGWLLLPGDRQGVSFLGSETGTQRTTFTFKALEHGEYDLTFQLQDNTRGASSGEVVRLRVLPEEKFRDLLAAPLEAGSTAAATGRAPTESEAGDSVRLQKAERLFAGGFYDLALPEYLGIYREADPLLNDRLAAIYLGKGEAAAAAKFYGRNLTSAPPYAQKALVGLVRAGLDSGSVELVLEHLPALLALPAAEIERELLTVARFAAAQGRYPLALDLLTEYLRRYPQGSGLDEAYFQLAQLYELESPMRDIRLARDYYRKVYDDFPESERANEAHSRILYLDRHFFHVQ